MLFPLLNWFGTKKFEDDRLKRPELFWRWSGFSCIRPWKGLFGSNPCWDWFSSWKIWFGSFMKKVEEGIGCDGLNDAPIGGEMRLSNCPVLIPPRRNMSLDGWCWSWIEGIWWPKEDNPKFMVLLLAPYKWLPMVLNVDGCLALSWARASQKALWVIKLSRL